MPISPQAERGSGGRRPGRAYWIFKFRGLFPPCFCFTALFATGRRVADDYGRRQGGSDGSRPEGVRSPLIKWPVHLPLKQVLFLNWNLPRHSSQSALPYSIRACWGLGLALGSLIWTGRCHSLAHLGGNTKGRVIEWTYEPPTQLKSSLNIYLLSGTMIARFAGMATLGANDEDTCPLADGRWVKRTWFAISDLIFRINWTFMSSAWNK